jgi:hypothetical protein
VHSLTTVPHLQVRRPGRIVPLVVLARSRERGQRLVNCRTSRRHRRFSVRVEWLLGRPGKRRAHEDEGAKYVRPYQRAPSRDGCPEIVPDDCSCAAIAQRKSQSQRVAHCVQEPKGSKVRIIVGAPTGRAAIATQVRRDDMEASGGEARHDLTPGIGDFWKAVQHQDQWAVRGIEPGFKDVHPKTVDIIHETRADARRQDVGSQWRH